MCSLSTLREAINDLFIYLLCNFIFIYYPFMHCKQLCKAAKQCTWIITFVVVRWYVCTVFQANLPVRDATPK